MEEHPYNPNARLKEIYSLYCACPKMSPSDFGVPEDSDVEENHHSQLMKELGVGLMFKEKNILGKLQKLVKTFSGLLLSEENKGRFPVVKMSMRFIGKALCRCR